MSNLNEFFSELRKQSGVTFDCGGQTVIIRVPATAVIPIPPEIADICPHAVRDNDGFGRCVKCGHSYGNNGVKE